VIRELRSHQRTRHCQVFVTSMLDPADIRVDDVDGMLLKPFDRAAVWAALGSVS
jgi:hypothetical protein